MDYAMLSRKKQDKVLACASNGGHVCIVGRGGVHAGSLMKAFFDEFNEWFKMDEKKMICRKTGGTITFTWLSAHHGLSTGEFDMVVIAPKWPDLRA